MTEQYQSRPAEEITSAFCSGSGENEAFDRGLKTLVETTSLERASLYLITSSGYLELTNQYSATKLSKFESNACPPEKGMAIILSCSGPGKVETFQKNSETQSKWKEYFDLCGNEYPWHSVIFLIAPMGSNFGFLSLEGSTGISETEKQIIGHSANALTMVIAYIRMSDRYKEKIDECAATANELIALKQK